MLKVTELRCYKNFRPMRIVNVPAKRKGCEMYNVLNQDGKTVGCFGFYDDGEVGDLFLDKSIRRKQASVNALLSIMDFVIDLAKQKKLDFIQFCAKKNNKNHVARLYEKFAQTDEKDHLLSKIFFMPVTENGQKQIEAFQQPLEFFSNPFDIFSL